MNGYTEAFVNEIDVLKRAKYYMDCMAVGENPLTGEEFGEDNEITSESFKKCFSYISGILDSEISRQKRSKDRSYRDGCGEYRDPYDVREFRDRPKRAMFFLSDAEKERVMISSDPVGINTVAARINDVIDQSKMKGVSGGKLAECLVEMGYLAVEEMPGGGRIRNATEKGALAGIETIDKTDSVGKAYKQNVYNTAMQRYLVENINEIVQTVACDRRTDCERPSETGDAESMPVRVFPMSYCPRQEPDTDTDEEDLYGI